jgi:hypothetical protein
VTNKKKKGGAKKGSTRNDKPQAFWFALCKKFERTKTQWRSQAAFLCSEKATDQKMSFSRALQKYKKGDLKTVNETRVHGREVEEKLL